MGAPLEQDSIAPRGDAILSLSQQTLLRSEPDNSKGEKP
jgi:hypothetical protein